jgi:NAD(P)-dependent dehydrogenase (short-subunit alcohol dehydrogenase family)
MADKTAILITGCSSGVGEAAARRFLRGGHKVYATARRPETLARLADAGATALPLDVTDEESMTVAVKRIETEHGAVGILVNNAGYGVRGAMEVMPLDQARAQFETNLFGMIRLSRLVLPAMRAKGSGRIVNVSAMGGHFSLPGTGVLHASKHAVRAVSNTMRLELRAFGIAVSMVEPGPVRTAFAGKANATLPPPGSSPSYDRFHSELAARLEAAYEENKVLPMVLSPDTVARAIERAALARRPRARYPVGIMSRYVIALSRILPDRALDMVVRQQFPVPRPLSPGRQRSPCRKFSCFP